MVLVKNNKFMVLLKFYSKFKNSDGVYTGIFSSLVIKSP